MSFTLNATMKSHVDGDPLPHMDFDISPIPNTTVDSSGKVVRSGGKRVTTDSLGKFTVSLATGEHLYYTIRRASGPTPFDPITFKAPIVDGGTMDLSDVVMVVNPFPAGGGGVGGGEPVRGISTITNTDDPNVILITYTDGTTGTITLPPSGGGGDGGGTTLTSYTQVSALPDYPSAFPPDLSGVDAGDVGAKPSDYTPTWGEVTEKPPTFPPSAHTHTAEDVGARPDTWKPGVGDVPAGTVFFVVWTGSAWPSRPTARTDVACIYIGGTAATPPTGFVENKDLWVRDES